MTKLRAGSAGPTEPGGDRTKLEESLQALEAAMRSQSPDADRMQVLRDWVATGTLGTSMKLRVLDVLIQKLYRRDRPDSVHKICEALRSASFVDPDLTRQVRRYALVREAEVLVHLADFDRARLIITTMLAEQASEADGRAVLPGALLIAGNLMSRTGDYEGAASAMALNRQLIEVGSDIDTVTIANSVCRVLLNVGALEQALHGYTLTLARFGGDSCTLEICGAMAGRADTLLALGRIDECDKTIAQLLALLSCRGDGDREARSLEAAALATQAVAMVRAGRYDGVVLVAKKVGREPIDPDAVLAALARISSELRAHERWREMLAVLDMASSVGCTSTDPRTRARIGLAKFTQAEILTILDEPERAAELREHAYLEYGEDVIRAFDEQLEEADLHAEPRRSVQRAMVLVAKARAVAGWDDDQLDTTLGQLSDIYLDDLPGVRELCADARDRWPEHFM